MSKRKEIKWLEGELREAGEGFERTVLCRVLKRELRRLGHWKNRPRGRVTQQFIEKQKRITNGD